MTGWISSWWVQYLAIALMGAITVYLNLFLTLPGEIANLLGRQARAHQEATAGILSAYIRARQSSGVAVEEALREVSPWLREYGLYAMPPDFPIALSGVSPLGITLTDGRILALGWGKGGCPSCMDPSFWFRLLGISMGIWVVLIAIHLLLWIRFSTWLDRIRRAAQAIAAGASNPPLPPPSRDELGQIARAMQEIATSQARFRDAYRRFLMAAAHELLTPMNIVIRELEELHSLLTSEEARQRAERALEHSWHLQRLMEDVLIAAREDRTSFLLRLEALDLADFLIAMVQAYAPRFEAMGRRLELRLEDLPLPVRADPTRLRQILGNLLENALRYSRAGDSVYVIAGRGERVMVEVQGGVFGERSAGTGIGMYIVEELMRAHGGSVEFLEGPDRILHARLIFPLDRSSL